MKSVLDIACFMNFNCEEAQKMLSKTFVVPQVKVSLMIGSVKIGLKNFAVEICPWQMKLVLVVCLIFIRMLYKLF